MRLPRAEFERLALEQMDAVDRVARSLARTSAEADDLTQETYLRAFRSADTFELQSFGIRPWLLRILHNVHNTRVVREARQPRAIDSEHLNSIRDPFARDADEPTPDEARAAEAVQAGVFASRDNSLARALDELAPELRSVIQLWAVDELTYREIAEVTEVPIGTVMSRLHRARRKLAARLQEPSSAGTGEGE